MAFLGDFGKIFLGGKTTRDVGGDVGQAVGSIFGPEGAVIGRSVGLDIGKDIGEIGDRKVDVSAPPAGIDSPASALPVSQTGMISPASQGFGRQQAFIGGAGLGALATQGIGAVGRALTRPGVGGLIGGLGAGAAAEFVMDAFGNQKKLVITRKLQRDTKKLFMMTGGNIDIVSQQSLFFLGKDLSPQQVLAVLFKTFKNNGPYVTKAAVRKTRQTIRKLDTLTMLKDQMCPPKRAPARRRTMGSTTKVLQVK
jgi:hypothetical protein